MNHDVVITDVINVYFREKMQWTRNKMTARQYEAIAFFVDGSIEYRFPNKTITAKRGDILFLPGNVPYSGRKLSDRVVYYVVDFHCLHDGEFENFGAPCIVSPQNYEAMLVRFRQALDLWNNYTADVAIAIKALLYSLFVMRYQERVENKKGIRNDEIIAYIAEHIDDSALTVRDLCRIFFMSESQLRRNLYKVTGLSPNDYILTLRMNRAKEMLINTDEQIKEISAWCGFSSPYYFSRCFTRSTGYSPSQYRTLMSL